jgi:signal transduction histidine kinase/CheY-like chemotaxis protein
MIALSEGVGEQSLRVLDLTLTVKDGKLINEVLRSASIECLTCSSLAELVAEAERGVGALIVTEEALAADGICGLATFVSRQPAWSDVPILLLTRSGADSAIAIRAAESLGNITLLERPIRIAALVSSLRSALRARQRQYQLRTHLLEKEKNEQVLRELDRRKDEFLATLSHELRNPLAPLTNSLQLLRMAKLDPSIARATEVMMRQVNHLERLVDDLLEVSRITRGRIELKPEVVCLGDVAIAALETSRPLAEVAEHDLRSEIPESPIMVYGDPVRLIQVVTNLLNNAIKYSDRGSNIILTIGYADSGTAFISVRDDGIGIDAMMLPHVFDMFTQVDRSLRRAQGGLGIGLTLVKTLIEMHGGTVEAQSDGLGKGSEFRVLLPVMQGQIERLAVAEERDDVWKLEGLRTMVVDDNSDAAESIALVLSSLGATVRVAHDGREALQMADEFRPSVILLDIGMPGLDGYSVARKIRRNPNLAGVVLIAVTGWGQLQDRQRSHDAGFDHHLVKPVSLDNLHEIFGLQKSEQQNGSRLSPG